MMGEIIQNLREIFTTFCSLFVKDVFPSIKGVNQKTDFLESFIFLKLPVLYLHQEGRLLYLTKEKNLEMMSFKLNGTITEEVLSSFSVKEVTFYDRLNSINEQRNKEDIEELIYHVKSWLELYDREIETDNPKIIKDINCGDVRKIIKWLTIPIYVFGYPRACIILPHIYQKLDKETYEEIQKISLSISKLLENALWDTFVGKVNKLIKDGESIENAFSKSFDILIPFCLNTNSNFNVIETEVNFNGNRIKLPIILPKVPNCGQANNNLDNLKIKQQNLFEKIILYLRYWMNIKSSILSHALRSAVAAIMARNMSHNIGSHVQHYLSKEDYFGNSDDFWIT